MKNIFIKNNRELEIGGCGKMASIKDLNERICLGDKEVKGLVQVEEGVFSFYNSTVSETEDENQENGEFMGYIKHENVRTLYMELMEDLEEGQECVVNCGTDENDMCLRAVTKSVFNDTVYIYNYSRFDDEVDKTRAITHIDMFKELFVD